MLAPHRLTPLEEARDSDKYLTLIGALSSCDTG